MNVPKIDVARNEYKERLVKKLTTIKLRAITASIKLTVYMPKTAKENMSNNKPAPNAHHKAYSKLPTISMKTRVTNIKLKLFRPRGNPLIKENSITVKHMTNNKFKKNLAYINI